MQSRIDVCVSRKIMKIPSILKKPKQRLQQWQWPAARASCKHPRTLSFRAAGGRSADDVYKTLNSVFLDPSTSFHHETPDSWWTTTFTNTCTTTTTTTTNNNNNNNSSDSGHGHDHDQSSSIETIIRRVKLSSDRLFFKPERTSSILDKAHDQIELELEAEEAAIRTASSRTSSSSDEDDDDLLVLLPPFKESVALAVESEDPYTDFKRSMQEMVETHGLVKDWDCLEELLGWYLRMNAHANHALIVAAFLDLLLLLQHQHQHQHRLAAVDSATTSSDLTSCYSSAESCFSSPGDHHHQLDRPHHLGVGDNYIDEDHVDVLLGGAAAGGR
ncbi:transcription repressor OFP13 [Andrographis paniculata]|uniref:transcription repressor OFP13 n=1 Tax=Andrographis paniculata TaxID=175694 RepID=UPI0021E7C874|nr:transcription repressor OFP13 [Andrographis paniculata]